MTCNNNLNILPKNINLKIMWDEYNIHTKYFRMAADRINDYFIPDLKLRLISERSTNGKIYNQPIMSKVIALIVGDIDTAKKIDIILERQSGRLKRICEFHSSYLACQYPLLFPRGKDGYKLRLIHRETNI